MVGIKKISLGFRYPSLLLREGNRLLYRSQNQSGYNENGIDVMDDDWDNLILLDGCRYDLFQQHGQDMGQLESRISRGSATWEFLHGNFKDRTLHDTVYVTANPQFYRHDIDCEFHTVENIWRDEGWDEEEGTVLPETVTERALVAQERYPDKRLLIHYMQPHFPFIGSDIGANKEFLKEDAEGFHVWMQLQTGKLDLDRETVWTAYQKNLERTLPHVEEAIDKLDGKSVVTSDHGNLFGERVRPIPVRLWGHPRRIYVDELVQVPWLIVDADDRPQITSETPQTSSTEVTDDVVESRLADLGYVE